MFDYLQLDYDKVAENCPKSVRKLKDWFLDNVGLKEFIEDMLPKKDDKAGIEHTINVIVQGVITQDPRKLYDFFEVQELQISTVFDYYNKTWSYNLPGMGGTVTGNSRVECEKTALLEAFETLEKQLYGTEGAKI